MSEQRFDQEPPMDLPQPNTNQAALNNETGLQQQSSETAQAVGVETGITTSGGGIVPVQGGVAPQTSSIMPVTPVAQAAFAVQAAQMPAIADDVDLIEKEWVDKAKEIVERTKADPYAQNKEMTMVKAEYLKKRYNKDLKPAED